VDTKARVQALAEWILAHKGLEIAFDCEGVDLSRDGRLYLVQLSDGASTWVVDVVVLGKDAFANGSIKEVLESDSILKVGYDGRAEADSLFGQFGVKLANMYDVQIASCKPQDSVEGQRDRFVHGLKRATNAFLTNDWQRVRGHQGG
jgi:ribonuclease D